MYKFLLFGMILALPVVPLGAENRFIIGGQTFLTGSTGQEVQLQVDNDALIYGLSFAMSFGIVK